MVKTRIVVGVDGSAGAMAAVRWAAAETRLRGADLRVVTAHHRRSPTAPASADEEAAAGILHAAVTQARSAAPGIEVRVLALPGYAVPVLLHAAEEAALLVVGSSRPDSGLPGLPHGSVRTQVATRAKGSVVVVRGRPGPEAGPVVVGVGDDGGTAGPIIGRAFEEAALRGAPVLAVTAQDGARRPSPSAAHTVGGELDDLLAPWRAQFPEVSAAREFTGGDPGKVLVERSRQARLVVVGPRRHGFEGVMLGAAGTRLLERADCPVMIAR
ncbi:universal stress protein [Couchioplanes azureus]|uniref:universal stress protein n=1 Tax=Couchioplanes caeruleus TaxID=56438 RepID=UPI00166F7944|nr:universal stress protein [Couchioplanes caeruleus]